MVKRLVAVAGAGALLLGVAVPALASFRHHYGGSSDTAIVLNSAEAYSNTGGNSQSNVALVTHGGGVEVYGAGGDRTMDTGDAESYAGALVVANTHKGCGCRGDYNHKDFAMIGNGAYAGANTGENAQDDFARVSYGGGVKVYGGLGDRDLDTGDATSESRAWTVVNTHWGY